MNSIVQAVASEGVSLPGEALTLDAAGNPVLIGCACRSCGAQMFPVAPVCSVCMSEDLARAAMSRRGTLYAFTVVHVGPKDWAKPYLLGYVDLENGVRVFSHLRGAVRIGDAVEMVTAVIGETASGSKISTFVFQPAEA